MKEILASLVPSLMLTSLVNAFNYTKCVSLSKQKCMIQCALINLHLTNTIKDYVTIHLQLI